MDFSNQSVYIGTGSVRFSSFPIYSVHELNCRNCKRLREFLEI
jgi:hypothetical protein